MGKILINQTGGGGVTSEDVTQVKAHVLKGETALTADSNDEVVVGEMTVNSLLSFSVAAYSGRRVLAKWQNPKAAKGKPYSGVYIRYSTSGYPGKTGGTQVYKGAGSNTASEGQSQAYFDLPALNTTYYLSCIPYVTCSAGEMTGDVRNGTVKTSAEINLTIKATQTYTVPTGYTRLDSFCVGGGGGGINSVLLGGNTSGFYRYPGGGGGGGYTKTVKGTVISAGQVLACTVGAGGAPSASGGGTSIVRSGTTINSAAGGVGRTKSAAHTNEYGCDGGSGGGRAGYGGRGVSVGYDRGGQGGSNGSNGYRNGTTDTTNGGKGQGSTTRAWGSSSGTLYSGGGGGASFSTYGSVYAAGGAGGGGAGFWAKATNYSQGDSNWTEYEVHSPVNGAANSGGGGGGAGADTRNSDQIAASGGSGVILLRLY